MRLLSLILSLGFSMVLQARDLSEEYQKNKKSQFTAAEIHLLRNYKIILVPGVLAESFSFNGSNQIKMGFIFEDAFREQKKIFKESGLDYEYVNIDTESSPEHNAETIAAVIESSARPVLIYSHSKGGLDTLETFRKRPDLIAKVSGWVSVQSPFWGSRIASMMLENKQIRETGTTLFEWMGGEAGGMSSLTLAQRQFVMETAETQKLIEQLNKEIRFINYSSYKPDRLGVDTPMELFRDITEKYDGDNDGVVSVKSALMKNYGYNVDHIIESSVDHMMTVSKYRPDHLDFLNWYRKSYSIREHTASLIKLLID